MKIISAVYSHPEYYPPTLNALNELSTIADSITVLARNVYKSEWKYPPNVSVEVTGKYRAITESQHSTGIWKFFSFLHFTIKFYTLIKKIRPQWVLCYDPIPLLSFYIVNLFLSNKPRIWYHNHDVVKVDTTRKYSIGWWAHAAEQKLFNRLSIFSLPTDDRKSFFNMKSLNGAYFCIPNYPSLEFYNRFHKTNKSINEVTLIYQGKIDDGHGIKEVISSLSSTEKLKLNMVLIGHISEEYKDELLLLITSLKINDKVHILDAVNYSQLPSITSSCHIGLAINTPFNLMYATGGTASNKIYEYAALGLPILYYDNEQYNKYLNKFKWAVKCNLKTESLLEAIEHIINNYIELSQQAREDFKKILNFEKYFEPVIKYINIDEN